MPIPAVISILARIVSIADAFDALTSTRPYRRGVTASPAVTVLKIEAGSQFDARLLDLLVQMVKSDRLQAFVGHSESGVAMLGCPSCGPVITVSRHAQDGDVGFCRVCGAMHRLHRDQETFAVEPTGAMGSAEDLKPHPEVGSIAALVARAPAWVEL